MNLNSQQREQMRLSILRWLTTSPVFGLMESLLLEYLRNEGLRGLTLDQLKAELVYLADKDLVVKGDKKVSPENPMWRITAEGRDFYAEGGNE